MNVLVTGAAGFIGSHLSERLLAAGHRVVGLDEFAHNYDVQLKEHNAIALARSEWFHLIRGNLEDTDKLGSILVDHGCEAVVHLAARPGVAPSLKDPAGYFEANVQGSARLLDACRRAGVGHTVLASSSSVYGNLGDVPFRESRTDLDPVSPYGASKLAMETVARSYHHLGLEHVALLRLFTVYGPRQRPEMAIHRFTRKLLRGEEISLYARGESERDYTYIDDIVTGIVRVLDRPRGFQILNLGKGEPVSLMRLVELLGKALGVDPRYRLEPPREGDMTRTWADISRAREAIGYEPSTGIEEGVRRFVDWYMQRREELDAQPD